MKRRLRHIVLAAAFLNGAGVACATDLPSPTTAPAPPPASSQWIVTLSGEFFMAPAYPGAKYYNPYGAPGISVRPADEPERFSTPDESFGISLYDNSWLHIGPVGRYIGSRPVANHPELRGLPSVDPSIEIGGFVELTPLPWMRAKVEALQAVDGNDGLQAIVYADAWRRFGDLTLSIGPRFYFGSNKFVDAYFSVTPQQSAINIKSGGQLTPYDASGGLISYGLESIARYDINETWRVTGFGGYERLAGSAAGSPIPLHAGSLDQFNVGLEIGYRFKTESWFGFSF